MFALLLSFALPVFAAGTDVGNGGDVVNCAAMPAATSRFHGLYSVDYLMTLGPNDEPLTPDASVRSIDESLRRVQAQLDRLYPAMGSLFRDHVAELRNFTDWTRERIWTPSAQGLVDVRDERLVRRLPANCTGGSDPDVAHLIQAVIRQARPRTIQYQTDFELLSRLEREPLQYSYLIVHEWLWDFSEDPEAIRWANRLLHSRSLEQMDAASFRANLDGIGITMANYGYDRFCTRTDLVRSVLEELTGTPCERLTREQLQELNPIPNGARVPFLQVDLGNAGLTELKYGDFTGLTHLKTLMLFGNRLTRLDGDHFAGLTSLEALHLNNNQLTEIPAGLFDRLPQLKEVRLNLNQIASVPRGLLRSSYNLTVLDLTANPITELPADLLAARRSIRMQLVFAGCRIPSLPAGFFDSVPAGNANFLTAINLDLKSNPIPFDLQNAITRAAVDKAIRIIWN